jgi:hypothetical protein
VIGPTGKVLSSVVRESTVGNVEVETCMARALSRWQFPKPKSRGVVEVHYPVRVRPAGSS